MFEKNKSAASQSAKITTDLKRARKYDVVYREYRKLARQIIIAGLLFLALAVPLIWTGHYILGAILILTSILCFYFAARKGSGSAKELTAIYTTGLLIPAIVHRTDPLTVIALAPLANGSGSGPDRHGCREFEVKALPGHTVRKGERIPCTSMYGMSSNPDYFSHFEVRPVCWATGDVSEIQDNIDNMADPEEWDILAELAEKLPFNHTKMLYILDENFEPLVSRNYTSESGMEYLISQESKRNYIKRYDSLPDFRGEHPDVDTLIKLAYENQVAEYFLGFDGDKNRGYVTPFNNPDVSAAMISKYNVSLQSGEVVFVAGKTLITNKGVWSKSGFTPWNDVPVLMDTFGTGKLIHTYLGKTRLCCFDLCYDLYPVEKEEQERLVSLLKSLETQRLTDFWLNAKRIFAY